MNDNYKIMEGMIKLIFFSLSRNWYTTTSAKLAQTTKKEKCPRRTPNTTLPPFPQKKIHPPAFPSHPNFNLRFQIPRPSSATSSRLNATSNSTASTPKAPSPTCALSSRKTIPFLILHANPFRRNPKMPPSLKISCVPPASRNSRFPRCRSLLRSPSRIRETPLQESHTN